MKRIAICVFVGLLGMLVPRPADAAIGTFFDWLQELSGPGDFTGVGFEAGLLCRATPTAPRTAAAAQQSAAADTGGASELRVFCTRVDKRRPIGQLAFVVSHLHTDKNPYFYTGQKAALSGDVDALRLGVAFDQTLPLPDRPVLQRSLSFGVGFGALNFSGERFDSFTTYYVELPRVIVHPFAYAACRGADGCPARWTWWDAVDVRFLTTIIGGVDPVADFGATRGDETGAHFQTTITAGFTISF